MKFTVLGGDERMLGLCRLLQQDGHRLSVHALEKALPCDEEADFRDCDGVILPLPAEKNGALWTPLSHKTHDFSTLFDKIPAKTMVFAGKAGPALEQLCSEKGLRLRDYFLQEDFTQRNAELTAEGAIWLLMGAAPQALMGRRVVIYGFGRIGRALSLRLLALGAKVTVCARSRSQRMAARYMGCGEADFSARPRCDYAVNTVPVRHLRAEDFPGAVCLELASPPYGFEKSSSVIDGAALPGRYAPVSAAEAIKESIYTIINVEDDI